MNWGIIRLRNKITQLRVGGRPLDPLARRNLHALDVLRLEAPAREHNFVILDLQAADPRAGADQVLSVGAFRMLEGRVMLGEVFWQQCRPDHETTEETLPLQAEAAQTDGAPRPLAEVFDDFLAFIGTDILVAHQAALETFILAQAMKARSGFGLQNLMLDTLEMCRILLRPHAYGAYLDTQRCTLEQLTELYNLEVSEKRNALGDALTTALIFQRFLQKMEQDGQGSLRHLIRIGYYSH